MDLIKALNQSSPCNKVLGFNEDLLEKAIATPKGDWNAVEQLIQRCTCDKIRNKLFVIRNRRYREEEAWADNL